MDAQKQQTSIEWLICQISKPQWQSSMRGDIIEHAKQMHREEIENAYLADRYFWFEGDASDYYTETYGQ